VPVVEEPVVEPLALGPASALAEGTFTGGKPSPFVAVSSSAPFRQAAGTNVSGPQNIIRPPAASPTTVRVK
jgi:hypothetical protein